MTDIPRRMTNATLLRRRERMNSLSQWICSICHRHWPVPSLAKRCCKDFK